MEKENILGVDVCVATYDTLRESICKNMENKEKSFLVAINPEKILKARRDKELLQLLNRATYQIPDGIGAVYASKLQNGKIRERITGIDSMEMLCELATEKGFRIFLYGARREVVTAAKEKLEQQYPGIQIVGFMDGYQQDDQVVIDAINRSCADIIFVAMGSPKQENWIVDHMSQVSGVIFQGVGGSFDVISGNVKRAPKWMQKLGLEWFYRLLKDPRRIVRQIKLIQFLGLALFVRDKNNKQLEKRNF